MQHRKNSIMFSALLFLLCGCAAAAKILYPVTIDPLRATPGVYSLDPTHANIIFSVNHLGFSMHHGRFNQIEGSLDLDPKTPENSHLYIQIKADSIDTNSVELDEKLRAKTMLDTATYPFITFESENIVLTDPKTATIEGQLTMAGVRKKFQIEATFIGSGTNPLNGAKTVGFSGQGSLLRSDYGLKEWLPFVGDEVSFVIEAEFIRPK